MRRALIQRTRPTIQTYEKGQWVMMWKQRGEHQGQWIGPAQIIVQEGSQVAWTAMASKLYRIAPEHLRPVSTQEQSKCEETLQDRGNQNTAIGQGVTQFHDWLATITPSPMTPPTIPNQEKETTEMTADTGLEHENETGVSNEEHIIPNQIKSQVLCQGRLLWKYLKMILP